MNTKTKTIRANILLVFASLIWGSAFVAQSAAMDTIAPFTFMTARFIVAAAVLLPVALLLRRREPDKAKRPSVKKTLLVGLIVGGILFTSSALQQFGLVTTSAGKAGFITSLYIVIVPILGLFFKRRASMFVWISVAVALVGLYLLCLTETFTIATGDLLILCCALAFSFHIMTVDHFSNSVDWVLLSCVQMFVTAVISCPLMFIFEQPDMGAILQAWLPILYAGVLSGGVAYTLQIICQHDLKPAIASLIMSLESVFAALSGWLILGETLTAREFAGCALMFAAVLVSQINIKKKTSDIKQ